jgi:PAS domain S-box-containing protein
MKQSFALLPVGIFQLDCQGNCIYVNPKWSELTGISAEEALGLGWLKSLPSAYQNQWFNLNLEKIIYQNNYLWLALQIVTETDQEGKIINYLGTVIEIQPPPKTTLENQQLKLELELVKKELNQMSYRFHLLEGNLSSSESELRGFFDAMTDIILILDQEVSNIKIAPTHPERLYEYKAEIINLTIEQFFNENSDFFIPKIREALAINQIINFEYNLLFAEAEFWFSATISPLEKNRVIWVARDITKLKQVENNLTKLTKELEARVNQRTHDLAKAKEQLQAVLDAVPGFISWFSKDGYYLGVNQYLADSFNLKIEDFTGQKIGFIQCESNFYRFIQNLLNCEDQSGSIIAEETFNNLTQYYWIVAQKYHNNEALVAVGINITQKIQAEKALEKLNQNLEKKVAQRTQELQEFVYVASHDLQEPLRKIQVFSDRLQSQWSNQLDPKGQDYLQRMQNAAIRMQQLIKDLLELSRITSQAKPFTKVALSEILSDVISDLEMRIEELEATVEISELPILEADPTQMRQLFQNLIGNALKFHQKDQQPRVKIFQETPIEQDCCCIIIVEDNGIGFDEKYKDKIFNPFQRLHSHKEYEGTGIGLAICRKIVDQHGGKITVSSRPGQGSKFKLMLPLKSRLLN